MEAGTAKPGKLTVYERDVALAVLYGTPCIILLRHQPGANRSTGTASVYVYTVHKYVFFQLKLNCISITFYIYFVLFLYF